MKTKINYQVKENYEKNRERLLQKQNDRYIIYKELLKSYVESENKLKTLEERLINFNSAT